MVDHLGRKILKKSAAATTMAAAARVIAQQPGQGGAAGSFYAKGPVHIHYQECGSGFPLLLIAGGGLNSTIAGFNNPFDAIGEFKGEFAASRRTCAMRIPASPPDRWKSTGRGMPTPMIISA